MTAHFYCAKTVIELSELNIFQARNMTIFHSKYFKGTVVNRYCYTLKVKGNLELEQHFKLRSQKDIIIKSEGLIKNNWPDLNSKFPINN